MAKRSVKNLKNGISERTAVCSRCNKKKKITQFPYPQNRKNRNYRRRDYCRGCGNKKFINNGPYKNPGKNKAWKKAVAAKNKQQQQYKTRFVEPGTPIGEG